MATWRDLRFSARLLARNRGPYAAAVLALAVGIGSCTAVFSVVHAVLLARLPYPGSERMVAVSEVGARGQRMSFSDPDFEDVRDASRSFSALAQYSAGTESVSGGTTPVRAEVAVVSERFFDVVATPPWRGRAFSAEEHTEGAATTAVVSEGFWRSTLGATADLERARLRIEGHDVAVIGVMPAGFAFPVGTQVWLPRGLYPRLPSRTAHNWKVVGRLREGATLAGARAEVSGIARRLRARYGDDTSMVDTEVLALRDALTHAARPALLVLSGAVGFLLLVACANVTNLLLAQATARRRELAVRMAVGAARRQIVGQLLTESLVLCLLGGGLGVLVAGWGVRALLALEPGRLPRAGDVHLSLPVLAFSFATCLVTALGIGWLLAWRATRGASAASLHEGQRAAAGGSARRTLDLLVLSQVAATVALLVGAGLLGHSLFRLLSVDPGFRTSRVLALDVSFADSGDDRSSLARRVAFFDAAATRLRALPGVREVGAINAVPLGGEGADGTFLVVDHEPAGLEEFERLARDPAVAGEAEYRVATADYFRAVGIPLEQGRLFDDADGPDSPPVAVVSASLVRARWPAQDPIGQRVEFGNMDGDLRLFTVVGVVGDVREAGLDRPPRPVFYANFRQRPAAAGQLSVLVHGEAAPEAIVPAARQIVRGLDPQMPPRFRTLDQVRQDSIADRRFTLSLLAVFAISALLLAGLGIYGVASYSVARRTREVGIRMALGAQPRGVLRLVLGETVRPVAAGALLGAALALALSRLLRGLLFEVAPADPLTLAGVGVALGLVALAAGLGPARRATRVDPVVALRAE